MSDYCYRQTGKANCYKIGEVEYFYELGKERKDGAITGQIKKVIGGLCYPAGGFRIEPDGTFARGPKLFKDLPVYVLTIYEGRKELVIDWEVSKRGEPTEDTLWAAVKSWADGYKPDGPNYHISKALGHIPYPTAANVVDLRTGETVVAWKAATFQVWD